MNLDFYISHLEILYFEFFLDINFKLSKKINMVMIKGLKNSNILLMQIIDYYICQKPNFDKM